MKTPRRLLIAVQLLLAVVYTLPLFSSQLTKDSDFVSFYTGWSIVRNGEGHKLYDLALQTDYQADIFGPEGAPFRYRLLPFINPPHAALLFMPFAYLPLNSAAYVFLAFNCLVAGWILRRLWELASGWTSTSRMLLVTSVLGTEVLWYGLITRTMTLIVFASLIEYYFALKRKQHGRAAIWLFVATLKPQLILLPTLIPLAQRRWRVLTITLCLGLAAAIVVSLVLGFHIWLAYFQTLREISINGAEYGASVTLMNNLRMVLHRLFPSTMVLPIVYFGLFCGVIGTSWLWRSTRDFEMLFAITVMSGLLLAPHLNYQDTLLGVFSASIAYGRVRYKKPKLVYAIQLCILLATLAPPVLIFSGNRTLRWLWPLPVMVTLMVVCISALSRHADTQDDD